MIHLSYDILADYFLEVSVIVNGTGNEESDKNTIHKIMEHTCNELPIDRLVLREPGKMPLYLPYGCIEMFADLVDHFGIGNVFIGAESEEAEISIEPGNQCEVLRYVETRRDDYYQRLEKLEREWNYRKFVIEYGHLYTYIAEDLGGVIAGKAFDPLQVTNAIFPAVMASIEE